MAEIVLINPRFEVSYWGLEHALPFLHAKAILPVAGLPLLAALTPPEHRVRIIDENVEPLDFDACARAGLVALTGMNVQRRRMREILQELKRHGVFTVVGGPWVTINEDYFGDLADVVFIGEAEETWPRFLTEWSEGRHAKRYEQAEPTDMSKVPAPRLDLLKRGVYAHGSVQFTRGCPFACEFCDIIVVFGRRPRLKTPEQVAAELDGLVRQGMRSALVVDDNFVGNKRAMKDLLRAVVRWQKDRGYPLSFATEASIDLADDPELIALMVDANFDAVFVGIETPNEAALRETKKLQNLRKGGTMIDKVRRIQAAGIEVWSGMMVGFDSDDATIFDKQIRFIREARIVHTMVNMLVALPKTPLHARLQREGRLDPEDFSPWGTNVVPLGMTRDQLRDGYVGVLRELYAPKAYFDRLDALFSETPVIPDQARRRHLRDKPWRRRADTARLLFEGGAVFISLMTKLKDPLLRRQYRGRMWRLLKTRPEPTRLQIYAVKCAMHYHAYTMVRQMESGPVINSY